MSSLILSILSVRFVYLWCVILVSVCPMQRYVVQQLDGPVLVTKLTIDHAEHFVGGSACPTIHGLRSLPSAIRAAPSWGCGTCPPTKSVYKDAHE